MKEEGRCLVGIRMEIENLTSIREFLVLDLSVHHKTQMILFATILLIYSLTLLGNLAVIMLVQSNQPPNSDICYTTSTMPQMLAHLLLDHGTISFIHCAIQIYISTTFSGTECFLLAVMAYDSYLAISINITMTFQHTFCGSKHINHFFCDLPLVVKLACRDTNVTEIILFWTLVLVILRPLIIVLTSYALILFMMFQMRSMASWHKAFSMCASHLASESASNRNKQIAVFYTVVTPLANHIIYTLRNKDIHKASSKFDEGAKGGEFWEKHSFIGGGYLMEEGDGQSSYSSEEEKAPMLLHFSYLCSWATLNQSVRFNPADGYKDATVLTAGEELLSFEGAICETLPVLLTTSSTPKMMLVSCLFLSMGPRYRMMPGTFCPEAEVIWTLTRSPFPRALSFCIHRSCLKSARRSSPLVTASSNPDWAPLSSLAIEGGTRTTFSASKTLAQNVPLGETTRASSWLSKLPLGTLTSPPAFASPVKSFTAI
ncbi:Olfactory receptor 10G7, partial [Ophiophagus hannah]